VVTVGSDHGVSVHLGVDDLASESVAHLHGVAGLHVDRGVVERLGVDFNPLLAIPLEAVDFAAHALDVEVPVELNVDGVAVGLDRPVHVLVAVDVDDAARHGLIGHLVLLITHGDLDLAEVVAIGDGGLDAGVTFADAVPVVQDAVGDVGELVVVDGGGHEDGGVVAGVHVGLAAVVDVAVGSVRVGVVARDPEDREEDHHGEVAHGGSRGLLLGLRLNQHGQGTGIVGTRASIYL
jgi:hypothetical protein